MIYSQNLSIKSILAPFCRIGRRYHMAIKLKQESRLVSEESMKVLYEFEFQQEDSAQIP